MKKTNRKQTRVKGNEDRRVVEFWLRKLAKDEASKKCAGRGTRSLPLVSLPGRAGMDLNLTLAYNSLVWTKVASNVISFDDDRGFPSPGFRLGFPVIQPLYFNSEVGQNAYLLIGPDGGRERLPTT